MSDEWMEKWKDLRNWKVEGNLSTLLDFEPQHPLKIYVTSLTLYCIPSDVEILQKICADNDWVSMRNFAINAGLGKESNIPWVSIDQCWVKD